jgi:hypothetical protein
MSRSQITLTTCLTKEMEQYKYVCGVFWMEENIDDQSIFDGKHTKNVSFDRDRHTVQTTFTFNDNESQTVDKMLKKIGYIYIMVLPADWSENKQFILPVEKFTIS